MECFVLFSPQHPTRYATSDMSCKMFNTAFCISFFIHLVLCITPNTLSGVL